MKIEVSSTARVGADIIRNYGAAKRTQAMAEYLWEHDLGTRPSDDWTVVDGFNPSLLYQGAWTDQFGVSIVIREHPLNRPDAARFERVVRELVAFMRQAYGATRPEEVIRETDEQGRQTAEIRVWMGEPTSIGD